MRKKTIEEHAISGTIRLDKVRTAKLATVAEVPRPQKYLTKAGVKIYKEICAHLLEHNSLCKIDSHYISSVARAMDVFNRMAIEIERKEADEPGSGFFQVFQTGAKQFSAEYILMKTEWQNIETGCKNLGLNLKSRDMILAFAKSPDEGDEGEELNLN